MWSRIAIYSLIIMCNVPHCFADGSEIQTSSPTAVQPFKTVDDPRLPAVLPGQEVDAGGGKTMKVWSTSGPVPVASEPAAKSPTVKLGDVDVLVDTRKREVEEGARSAGGELPR